MLVHVLLFFLAFVPVCRAEYYDADGDIDRADTYDKYNEEIKAPPKITTVMEGRTRLKRWDMDDLGTLSQEEPIVDVKGVLNNILQGDQPDALRGPRNPQQHTDSYVYVENAVGDKAEYLPNQEREFQQWMPTLEVSNRSPSEEKQENTIESRSESVTEQHWTFVYQPETSTNDKNDIIAEVRKMQPIKEGEVSRRFSIETWGTTEGTEDTVDPNNYPQESTTYNPSEMQAEVKKLVQHWTPSTNADTDLKESPMYRPSEMQAEVRKLVQQWSASSKINNYPQESTTYNPSEMQAEVKKLVQHWTPSTNADNYPQESSTYNPSEMQAEVKKLVQHWTPATNADTDPQESPMYRPSEMQAEVKKLVQQWSASSKINRGASAPFCTLLPTLMPTHPYLKSSSYVSAGMRADVRNSVQHWSTSSSVQDMSTSSRVSHRSYTSKVQHWKSAMAKSPIPKMNRQKAVMHTVVKELKPYIPRFKQEHWNSANLLPLNASDDVQHHPRHPRPFAPVQKLSSSDDDPQRSSFVSVQIVSGTIDARYWNSIGADNQNDPAFNPSDDSEDNVSKNIMRQDDENAPGSPESASSPDAAPDPDPSISSMDSPESASSPDSSPEGSSSSMDSPESASSPDSSPEGSSSSMDSSESASSADSSTDGSASSMDASESNNSSASSLDDLANSSMNTSESTNSSITTSVNTTTTTEKTTTTTTTEKQPIDIDEIMAIISNLTYDYEWNLTEAFNKSVIDHGVPTCPWKGGGKWGPMGAWTATTATTSTYDFENASIVNKCFVCGLTDEEIPRDAYCADAFAGDFLPLMPIDARSRGKIASFRKYCRYIDVQNYIENPLEPKAIYGRFTGGCAVRWTDLTGVYTQRTCRARYRPLLGKHFASKRMAKLELALVSVDNGCIISPMATLLPVSRGISLYARFHACVCTGNWCNRAILINISTNTVVAFVLYWLLHTCPS